jgi:hypothetical protein
MDILNFISWIKGGRYTTTPPANSVTVIGAPSSNRDDKYLPITVPLSALQTNIGKLLGGGIVVAEWDENGVKKALVASLTNLSTSLPWTIPAFQSTLIGPTAQNYNGLTNTNAIIAQTLLPADTTYAAGIARLYLGGGFNDWYLPSLLELNMCYNSAVIVNRVLGSTNGFANGTYWSSTETNSTSARRILFSDSAVLSSSKPGTSNVRAVRIHNL